MRVTIDREICLEYYTVDKEINIWLELGDEIKIVSLDNTNNAFYDKRMTIENEQFFELYNPLAEVNIKEFLENNGEGDEQGKDGANFLLEFGGTVDKVHFRLVEVTKDNMEKRKIKSICDVVKKILEIAEIDRKDYENDF